MSLWRLKFKVPTQFRRPLSLSWLMKPIRLGRQYFGPQNRVLKESWRLVWRPKWCLEGVFGVSLGSKIESWKHLGSQDRLKMRILGGASVHVIDFWTILEAPRRPKSIKNRVKMILRMIKVKMLIFDTPPLQNQYFWGPMEVKMEVKWGLKSIFIAIENDDGKVMLYREGSVS